MSRVVDSAGFRGGGGCFRCGVQNTMWALGHGRSLLSPQRAQRITEEVGDHTRSQNPHFWQDRPEMGHPGSSLLSQVWSFRIWLSARERLMNRCAWRCLVSLFLCLGSVSGWAQAAREKVIIDTDIGDDVDDAFALALAVKSPELEILGVTTAFGETEVRAQIADRFLGEVGRAEIPVMAGKAAGKTTMSQRRYAEDGK